MSARSVIKVLVKAGGGGREGGGKGGRDREGLGGGGRETGRERGREVKGEKEKEGRDGGTQKLQPFVP